MLNAQLPQNRRSGRHRSPVPHRRSRTAAALLRVVLTGLLSVAASVMVGSSARADVQIIGAFDSLTPAGPGQAWLTGWAFEGTTESTGMPPQVDITVVVGATIYPFTAQLPRPDVQDHFGLTADAYGFAVQVPFPESATQACVYANMPGDPQNLLVGCKNEPSGEPISALDTVDVSLVPPPKGPYTYQVVLTGWTFDPDAAAGPGFVAVYAKGLSGLIGGGFWVETSIARPDVQAAYNLSYDDVGYRITFEAQYCTFYTRLYGINTAGAGTNPIFFNADDILGGRIAPPPVDYCIDRSGN